MKALTLLMVFLSVACGKIGSSQKSSVEKQNVSPIYSSSQLNVKVYYETGAEPYNDQVAALNMSLWDMFQTNIEALFEGRSTVVSAPKTLPEMIKLQSYNKSTWSVEEIEKLATEYPLAS